MTYPIIRVAGAVLAGVALMLTPMAWAESTDAIEEQAKQVDSIFPSVDDIATNEIEKLKDAYLKERSLKIGFGTKTDGSRYYIGWSSQSISLDSKNIAWPDSRLAAFEKAKLNALGEYIALEQKVVATETIARFLNDERPFDPNDVVGGTSKIRAFVDKLAVLAESKLDAALVEQGIDPSQYGEKKRALLQDSILKKSSVKAAGSAAGVQILATFEDLNSVGALFVVSNKTRQDAADLLAGGNVSYSTQVSGPSITEQLQQACPDDACMVTQHGIRIMKDEFGNDVLVSFAQAGVKATKSASKLRFNAAVQAAKETASLTATGQFSEFANAHLSLSKESEAFESVLVDEVKSDGMTEEQESVAIGKKIDNLLRQRSRLTITGDTAVRSWSANHPDTGHLLMGEVRMWSPYTKDNSTMKAKPQRASSSGTQTEPTNKARSGTKFDGSF